MGVLYADGHVHLYPAFDQLALFAQAIARSERLGAPLALLLAECVDEGGFRGLQRALDTGPRGRLHALRLRATKEACSVAIGAEPGTAGSVLVVAGRQLVSREGLEVLALCLDPDDPLYALGDRELAAEALVRRALDAGTAAVLPWGVGKWLGARGRLVKALVGERALAADPLFFVGDIAHRAWPWPTPAAFRGAARVLAGTDPLPLAGLEPRVASYGFRIEGELDPWRPAASLLELLRARAPLATAGRRATLPAMLREQLAMRFRRDRAVAGGDAARGAT
jgi:hypothetical protein